jgi:hypothetical protein
MEIEPQKKSRNIVFAYAQSIREFFIPITRKDRQKRIKQYKDVLVFLTAIFVMSTFESKIEKFLSVDPTEVQKITKMQGGPL